MTWQVPSALKLSHADPSLQHSCEFFFLTFIKNSITQSTPVILVTLPKLRLRKSWGEVCTSIKISHIYLSPLFLLHTLHFRSHIQSFACLMQSSLTSSLKSWRRPISHIPQRLNYLQTVYQRTFPRSVVQVSRYIVKDFQINKNLKFPILWSLPFMAHFISHCPEATCSSSSYTNLMIMQIVPQHRNVKVLSGGL